MATYPHAAPAIRAELCRTIRSADDAKTVRDRKEKFAQAYGLAKALEIMSHSADISQPMAPGIAYEETLPARAVELTRQYLSNSANRILGLPEESANQAQTAPHGTADMPVIPIVKPVETNQLGSFLCQCGYPACSKQDLDEHVCSR